MDSVEPTQDKGTLRLRDLVQKHRVCWEVWSILLSSAQRLQVGCELVLYGTHANEQEPDRAVPDCPRRAEVYHRLRQIGEWLLPPPGRESRYDIQIFDRSLGYSPQRGGRPGVQLNIRMLQRNHSDRPVDNWEIHCLNEMRAKLESLGAPKGRWRSLKQVPSLTRQQIE